MCICFAVLRLYTAFGAQSFGLAGLGNALEMIPTCLLGAIRTIFPSV